LLFHFDENMIDMDDDKINDNELKRYRSSTLDSSSLNISREIMIEDNEFMLKPHELAALTYKEYYQDSGLQFDIPISFRKRSNSGLI